MSVGLTTSGAVGARTGKNNALELIEIENGEKLTETAARKFKIQVGRSYHDATVLTAAPYDPTGAKLRE